MLRNNSNQYIRLKWDTWFAFNKNESLLSLEYSTIKIIFVFSILIVPTLLSSCASYEATTKKQESLDYEAISVQPAWEYKERPVQKFILPAVGSVAGAAYGYQTTFTYDNETFEGAENAAIWAVMGLLGGTILNRVFLSRQSHGDRPFELSDSQEWLQKWNSSTGNKYIINKETMNNSLILVPRDKVSLIRKEYEALENDLNRLDPSTNYTTLQEWNRKLTEEYSILPVPEIKYVQKLISKNEVKIASANLKSQLSTIDNMDPTYNTVTTLLRLSNNLGVIYHLASPEIRELFDNQVQNKIDTVLTKILPSELKKLNDINGSLQSIDELNELFQGFNRRYRMLQDHDSVKAVYDQFHEKKEAILITNADKIATQIEKISTINQLEALDSHYSVALRPNSRNNTVAHQLLSQQKQKIIAAERQKQIEAQAAAQQRAQAALAAKNTALAEENAQLASNSFSANGLRNETLVKKIYRGEFTDINLARDDMRFAVLYNAYLESYGRQCPTYLPANKVEMTYQECNEWMVTRNGWGVETNRSCVGWTTKGTNIYADPDLYKVKLELEMLQTSDTFRNMIGLMSTDTPLANTFNLVGDATVLRKDMNTLLQVNACNSPGIKRFEDNLRLFALNKRPKKLSGGAIISTVINPLPGTLFEDQNYTELIEDLVYDHAQSWVMNQYIRGSVSNISVSSRDALDRPIKIKAQYLYNGFSNRSRGTVTLTFDEGWPECLYFFDNPVACRTPNRRIVDAYANGDYQK